MESDSGKAIERDSGTEPEMERELLKKMGKEKHQSLVKEIISVERERRDLLGSLTPTFSLWKEVDSQTTWTIARKEPATSSSSSRDNDDENQLVEYVDLMLQDMEDLGHRMLSMLYFLNKSNEPICSYKASELRNTAAKLNTHISKEFNTNHDQEPEPEQINLSSLFRKYSRSPNNYNNTLAKLVIEEEDDKRKYKGFMVEEEYQEEDVSTMEFLRKRMDIEQQFFAYNREYWEDVWGSRIGRCGGFMDTTTLSPMHFTHYTPDTIPFPAAVVGSTLQIYSIKIKNLKGINWPLKVYGVIAARDTVDRNRNILFSRSRFKYQELTREDYSLCLTGPSRAIVALDHVDFEIELQTVEGQKLIGLRHRLEDGPSSCSDGDGRSIVSLSNDCCTTELTLQRLDRSLQATIVGVRVTKGDWPFKYGCRVICFCAPASVADVIDTTCKPVVLFDRCGKGLHRGSENYIQLSRKVVSVESQGTLRVSIEAYGKSRRWIARKGHIDFPVQQCQTSTRDCSVGDATVEVVVAWSLLLKEKVDLLVDCPRPAIYVDM